MKSIKVKTWLYMMVMVMAILSLMWLLQVVFLQNFYEFTKENDVKRVQKNLIATLSQGDLSACYQSVLNISDKNELYVEVYDENKVPLLNPLMNFSLQSYQGRRVIVGQFMNDQLVRKLFDEMDTMGINSHMMKIVDRKSNLSGIILANKFTNSNSTFYLVTRASLMPVQATSDILKRIFLIILIFMLVVSLVGSFILSTSMTRPLRRLSYASKEVAKGNYELELPVESKDELGTLITDFNYMTKELSKVDSMRKDLIANVSHELRTPLTMIKGYAETIKDITGNNPEKRDNQLDIIIDETNRLSYLITNMLDLSQLQAGKIKFDMRDFNVSATINRILKQYDIFKDQGYTINASVDSDIYIKGDENRFEQVIYNLADNAINHCSDDKVINISLKNDDKPTIKFHNYGDIIDEDEILHIWDRYYKIDKTGKRRVTGTGIGLSIVKEILTAHKLNFGVTSNHEDGTTFWIELNPIG